MSPVPDLSQGKGFRAVEQIPGRGFAKQRFRRLGGSLLSLGLASALALACLTGAPIADAQSESRPSRSAIRKNKPAIPLMGPSTPAPVVPAPVVPAAPVAPPPAPPSADQLPPQPPTVAWDGKNLTIDADNSTLADILVAVRVRTGASIDMPPSTARERVFLHLGPAPVRDVLSSLLYGTEFDYVIQASDTDEDGLRSVVLTVRGKGDDSGTSVVEAQKEPGMRLMPGYAAPGKRTFEVAHSAQADAEGAAPVADEPASSTNGADPAAGSASAANDSQPVPPPPADSADAGSGGGLTNSSLTNRPLAASSGEASPSGGALPLMIEDMQHMFEQRRQLQAQQNQATASPSH